jgi:hypothetical protein
MRGGGIVRILLSAAVLLGVSACAVPTLIAPPSGRLTLSNFRFERASVETIVAAGPDCIAAGAAPAGFDLPFKGLRVIEATPGADICWRRLTAPGRWTEWNRAYTASGRSIDSQL